MIVLDCQASSFKPHGPQSETLIPLSWKTDVLWIWALASMRALKQLLWAPCVSKPLGVDGCEQQPARILSGGISRSLCKCLQVGISAEEQTSGLSIRGWQRTETLPTSPPSGSKFQRMRVQESAVWLYTVSDRAEDRNGVKLHWKLSHIIPSASPVRCFHNLAT